MTAETAVRIIYQVKSELNMSVTVKFKQNCYESVCGSFISNLPVWGSLFLKKVLHPCDVCKVFEHFCAQIIAKNK